MTHVSPVGADEPYQAASLQVTDGAGQGGAGGPVRPTADVRLKLSQRRPAGDVDARQRIDQQLALQAAQPRSLRVARHPPFPFPRLAVQMSAGESASARQGSASPPDLFLGVLQIKLVEQVQ